MSKFSLFYNFFRQFTRSKYRGTPYKINFVVTRKCDSRCMTCYIWKERNKTGSDSYIEMDLREIQIMLQKLPASITWLSITGGEPFLRNDLDQIILAALKNIPNLTFLSINSNGLCEDKILETIAKIRHVRNVYISFLFSLDGLSYLHNRIRGIPNGYERTWQTYEKVRSLIKNNMWIHVSLETTISHLNVTSLYPFLYDLIRHNHNAYITLAHNAEFYHNIGLPVVPAIDENLLQIINCVASHLSYFKPEDLIKRIYLRGIPFYLNPQQKYRFPCSAVKSSITIHPDGLITPCLIWPRKLVSLRQVNYNLVSTWQNLPLETVKKQIKEGNCPGCWMLCEASQSIIDNWLKILTWQWLLFKKFTL